MNREELIAGIESKLRGLRSCDTQPAAVAWMTGAYKLMEACLEQLSELPPPVIKERVVIQERIVVREKLVLVPDRPQLEVVQSIAPHARTSQPGWPGRTPTVVYPDVFLHPGLKPAPKAWTHNDTLRLERAVKAKIPAIQRQGR